jgi:hypothetical protein
MRSLKSLKSQELRVAGYIVKAVAFAKYVERKVDGFARHAIEELRDCVEKQRIIRQERLEFLALEAKKINAEIEELNDAHSRHTETLKSM